MSPNPDLPATHFRTRIKFCGLTRAEDLNAAVRLGVDAVGFVFDARSKRCVTPAQAALLADAAAPFITRVALFRDPDAMLVEEVLRLLRPDALQFHGTESREFCERWDWPYIKAASMQAPQDLTSYAAAYPLARALLLDSHAPGELGGTGHAFDWTQVPRNFSRPLVLAGGLKPGNVAQAVRMAAPDAVDVSSGIESAPGIKDAAKMRAFVEAVRSADLENNPS